MLSVKCQVSSAPVLDGRLEALPACLPIPCRSIRQLRHDAGHAAPLANIKERVAWMGGAWVRVRVIGER